MPATASSGTLILDTVLQEVVDDDRSLTGGTGIMFEPIASAGSQSPQPHLVQR